MPTVVGRIDYWDRPVLRTLFQAMAIAVAVRTVFAVATMVMALEKKMALHQRMLRMVEKTVGYIYFAIHRKLF